MTWIYAFPTWVFMPAVVIAMSALACLGLALVQRNRRKSDASITHNDVAGPLTSTVGGILAVMLSFMVVGVWQEFDASAATVQREASAASDLHQLADLLPQPTRNRLKGAVDAYVRSVIADDFPAMQHGSGQSYRTRDAGYVIFARVAGFQPKTAGQAQVQGSALQLSGALLDARRQRLNDNLRGIPPILWLTMIFIAAVTVVFSYFFRVQNVRAHYIMVVALSAVIAVSMTLVAELDYPFRGDTSITPNAFGRVDTLLHGHGD